MLDAMLDKIRRLTGGRSRPPAGLLPADQTRRALTVARATAERSGLCLSVIVFAPRTPESAAATWEILAKFLRRRLRVTDEAGWMDAGLACAILPFTPPAGAMKVADDVCRMFPEGVPAPVCTVHSSTGDDLPDGGGRRDTPDDRKATPAVPSRRGRAPAAGPQPAHAPLEPLFLRSASLPKRAVDVVGAAVGLAVLLPLLPILALVIRATSPGPVFFKQKRAGLGGRPFVMWKFRTMVADAEARKGELQGRNEQDGPAFKIKRDPRVTAVGRVLRATSVDELPQLWNVLRGDMSLVGPRPLPCGEADRCESWHRRRLDVVPGLTCIWQVRGRSAVSFDDWVRMDVEYIESQSLATDLRLILATVPAVALRKGAS